MAPLNQDAFMQALKAYRSASASPKRIAAKVSAAMQLAALISEAMGKDSILTITDASAKMEAWQLTALRQQVLNRVCLAYHKAEPLYNRSLRAHDYTAAHWLMQQGYITAGAKNRYGEVCLLPTEGGIKLWKQIRA